MNIDYEVRKFIAMIGVQVSLKKIVFFFTLRFFN